MRGRAETSRSRKKRERKGGHGSCGDGSRGKGHNGSSLGSLGSENERERDCADDEKTRRKMRVRETKYDRRRLVVTALGRGSVLCPPSKREDDSSVVVTRGHTNSCHTHCGHLVCASDHVFQTAVQAVCAVRDPGGRAEARLQKSARRNRKACIFSCT